MTGGGVYPALAVLQALKDKTEDVLWIGSKSGMEATLLKSYDLRYKSVSAAGLHGVGLRVLPGNLIRLFKGWREAKAIISGFNPDVMFFTGGYLGVPVAFAGRGIPSVVFLPDIEPGLALKTIIRYAECVAVSVPAADQYIRHPLIKLTGYPVRKELTRWSRAQGRRHFGIGKNEKVLLVFGGSQGARSINQALSRSLKKLLVNIHVIHITGKDHWKDARKILDSLNMGEKSRYYAFPFLHDKMGAAFAAADLVLCRAGASTLGELPFFGLPTILVPYPHAWRYQHQNAEYLQNNGGAVILEDQDLDSMLLPTINEIMNDTGRLKIMRSAMNSLSKPDAAEKIAELIIKTGKTNRTEEALNG